MTYLERHRVYQRWQPAHDSAQTIRSQEAVVLVSLVSLPALLALPEEGAVLGTADGRGREAGSEGAPGPQPAWSWGPWPASLKAPNAAKSHRSLQADFSPAEPPTRPQIV